MVGISGKTAYASGRLPNHACVSLYTDRRNCRGRRGASTGCAGTSIIKAKAGRGSYA